jgi:hypothetical protein
MKKLRVFVPASVVVALVLLLMAPAAALAAPNQGAKRGGGEEWYRVRRGDTLARIARVHGTSVWKLAEINDIEDPDLIYAGTSLCVDSDNGGWKADDNGRRKGDCSSSWRGGCSGWNDARYGNQYPYWSGTWNDGWNDGWNGN